VFQMAVWTVFPCHSMSRGRPTFTESNLAIVLISSQERPKSKPISVNADNPAFDRASNRERETQGRRLHCHERLEQLAALSNRHSLESLGVADISISYRSAECPERIGRCQGTFPTLASVLPGYALENRQAVFGPCRPTRSMSGTGGFR